MKDYVGGTLVHGMCCTQHFGQKIPRIDPFKKLAYMGE